MDQPNHQNIFVIWLFLTSFFLVSCSQQVDIHNPVLATTTAVNTQVDSAEENLNDVPNIPVPVSEQESDLLLDNEEEGFLTATPAISLTPTPDLRLLPEQWQQWPVIPEISHNTMTIYWKGIAMGNDPRRFSKIGDCQSIKEVLLGIYDLPNRYRLRESDADLQEIIDQFAGSFNRDGMAVKGGFNAATVLSPIWADPVLCKPGETPIECEFRVHNPSIVIISLEVWWEGRSPERYEQYMRKIIETAISHGIVPILSTKADNVEGNHNINYTTAKLAYEYDIPLWNFWLAVQSLPYQGIDPDRDGFHITVAAWNERSYTALQSLAAVWNAAHANSLDVEPETDDGGIAAYEPVIFSSNQLIDYGLSGTLVIETAITLEGIQYPNGLYAFDFDQGTFGRILEPGYEILDYHPDYGILAANATELGIYKEGMYLPFVSATGLLDNLSKFHVISENSFVQVKPTALSVEISVYGYDEIGNLSLASQKSLAVAVATIEDLNPNTIIAKPKNCNEEECEWVFINEYLSDQPRISHADIGAVSNLRMNEEGTQLGYWKNVASSESLFLGQMNPILQDTYVGLFGNVYLDQAWSHDGTNLAAVKMQRSDYYGKATALLHSIVNAQSFVVKTLPEMEGLNPQIAWSPDDVLIATSATILEGTDTTKFIIRLYDITTGQVEFVQEANMLQSESFIAITNLVWLR